MAGRLGHAEDIATSLVVASSTFAMRATLELADRLAVEAIMPAARHALVGATVLLTYFQKSPTIRLIPYAPLGVIGIDFSATGNRSRLLAIAHEAGHHVYRQLTVNYTAHLDEQIEALASPAPEAAKSWPLWLLPWQEEIFADIFATIVADPAAAVGLQQFILTGRPASLVEDDGDHPLDALRPQIMHTTLRVMAQQGNPERGAALLMSADALDAVWQEHLVQRSAPAEFVPVGGDAPVALAEAGAALKGLVREMLNGVFAPLVADADHTSWSSSDEAAANVFSASAAQFDETCDQLAGKTLPERSLRNNHHVVSAVRFPVEGDDTDRAVGETGDPYLDELRNAGLAVTALEAEQWKAVFLGGDWTTQGGGSGIKPPVFSRLPFWWLPYRPVRPSLRRG